MSSSRFVFKRPGDSDEGGASALSVERQITSDDPLLINPGSYASLSIQQQRTRLPIFDNRNHILYALETYQTLIVVGETGCGKSTQIPQYLHEAGWTDRGGLIGITQPRRISALSLAARVAEERSVILGDTVGYAVRFASALDPDRTRIKYLTDGILLREIAADPLLSDYAVIMVDEAHERSAQTDILIALLRRIADRRPELRLIVASATLNALTFRDYFNRNETADPTKDTATILSIKGRTYPVDIMYVKQPVPDYVVSAVNLILELHKTKPSVGDILTFLTGYEDIERALGLLREPARQISKERKLDKLWLVPLHGALPPSDQVKVFDSTPAGSRKIVLATNIAETAVTIPGIVYVIDCGFAKLRTLNKDTGLEGLVTTRISQAAANQRAGRAGRLRPGKAYRLYPETEFFKMAPDTPPEIQRMELSGVILQLKALDINNVLRFNFLSPPSSFAMVQGLELLYALGAIDGDCALVPSVGPRMADCPLSPKEAKVLFSSAEAGCSEEILSILGRKTLCL